MLQLSSAFQVVGILVVKTDPIFVSLACANYFDPLPSTTC